MYLDLLLKNKKFAPLMWTQFLGALNDNIFKNALVVIVTFRGLQLWGFGTEEIVALAGGIFILPFFLFSSLAGQLSDRFEKSKLTRLVKWLEVLIMSLAAIGFYLNNFNLLLICLFLMGLQSTLFGPVKFSIIPELLHRDQLVAGNAFVEMGTFIAILVGTIAGGLLATQNGGETYVSLFIVLVALAGVASSRRIPAVPIADSKLKIAWNPIPQTWQTMKITLPNKAVFNSILAISWFWFFGAALLSILPVMTKNLLQANGQVVTLFLAMFTVGIAFGAFLCERLSYKRVEIGLVPWGCLGISIFLFDLSWAVYQYTQLNDSTLNSPINDLMLSTHSADWFLAQKSAVRITVDLFLVSVFSGVFSVPLYTLMQERSHSSIRSRVIASNNILNALFMVISSVFLIFLYHFEISIPQILVIYGFLNLVICVYIFTVVPEFTLRFFSWMLARVLYRIRLSGIENIPEDGPAVLICNHVSFIDWLIIAAAVRRPVRFVMYYKFFKIPVVSYLFKSAKVIPIAGVQEDKALFDQAFDVVSSELRSGELVCIFPEGSITSDGELQPFKRGIEHILQRDPVPAVPMAIVGLWGSLFSRKNGPAFTKLPRKLWARIELRIGECLPASECSATLLHSKTKELL